jgi:hypothetical protein
VVDKLDRLLDRPPPGRGPRCWRWKPKPVAELVDLSWFPEGMRDREQLVALAALRAWQNGRCATCTLGDGGPLVYDHDHETGLLRGLLCRSCNIAEGTSMHPAFVGYRVRHPMLILGLEVRWTRPRPAATPNLAAEREMADIIGRLLDGGGAP